MISQEKSERDQAFLIVLSAVYPDSSGLTVEKIRFLIPINRDSKWQNVCHFEERERREIFLLFRRSASTSCHFEGAQAHPVISKEHSDWEILRPLHIEKRRFLIPINRDSKWQWGAFGMTVGGVRNDRKCSYAKVSQLFHGFFTRWSFLNLLRSITSNVYALPIL